VVIPVPKQQKSIKFAAQVYAKSKFYTQHNLILNFYLQALTLLHLSGGIWKTGIFSKLLYSQTRPLAQARNFNCAY